MAQLTANAQIHVSNWYYQVPIIERFGERIFLYERGETKPRGRLRITTIARFQDDDHGNIVFDLDEVAKQEEEDWTWGGLILLSPHHSGSLGRAIFKLVYPNGESTLREFDLPARQFVEAGFTLLKGWNDVVPLNGGELLFISTNGDPINKTNLGRPRTVRYWKPGTLVTDAPVIFMIEPSLQAVGARRDWTAPEERVLITYSDESATNISIFARSGKVCQFHLPADASWAVHSSQIAVWLLQPWKWRNNTYLAGALLVFSLDDVRDNVLGQPTVLCPGLEKCSPVDMLWIDGHLLANFIGKLLLPSVKIFRMNGDVQDVTPAGELVRINQFDMQKRNGTLLVQVEGPLTPPKLYLAQMSDRWNLNLSPLWEMPSMFKSDGLSVTHHQATTIDGRRVPYLQVGHKEISGPAPVCLRAYDGRIHDQLTYDPLYGTTWYPGGGFMVVASGLYADGFAAVAADLIRRSLTIAGKIAALGSYSLMRCMFLQYPRHIGGLCGEYAGEVAFTPSSILKSEFRPAFFLITRLGDQVFIDKSRDMARKLEGLPLAFYYEYQDLDSQQLAVVTFLKLKFFQKATRMIKDKNFRRLPTVSSKSYEDILNEWLSDHGTLPDVYSTMGF